MIAQRRAFHRFKIQRVVAVKARDHSNKSFLFTELWREVGSAGRLADAEGRVRELRHMNPRRRFRVVEEWPRGAEPRVVIPARK